MKRQLDKLTKRDIHGIKYWLYSSSDERFRICPFAGHCEKCLQIFPSLGEPGAVCPCDRFSAKYVTRVFKEVVKKWEAQHDLRQA